MGGEVQSGRENAELSPELGPSRATSCMRFTSTQHALACVMGDIYLLRALGLARIPCAVVAESGSPLLYSRFTRAAIRWDEEISADPENLVERLMCFAASQTEPPVLFYENTDHLLLISRYRERLATAFRFVVAEPTLVEDLVDKVRFQILAERLHLPVPATCRIKPAEATVVPKLDLRFPVVVKPPRRCAAWQKIGGWQKALPLGTPSDLQEVWSRLAAAGGEFLVQEMVPGPETCIESYHVYVDGKGNIAGEFTGRKIRTFPASCGHSTALTTTAAADVSALGRDLVDRLKLRGVAKFDFKRAPDGRLVLLEVNPRFNLWHHLGAVAGVNLPALVYADLVGLPRPAAREAMAGVQWCGVANDWPAAKADGLAFAPWVFWMLGCEAKALNWDDPLPFLRAVLLRSGSGKPNRKRKPYEATT
jgi:D-aspartate ligase